MIYHTFNDSNSTFAFNKILEAIEKNKMTVSTLYKHLNEFCEKISKLKFKFDENKSISFAEYLLDLS